MYPAVDYGWDTPSSLANAEGYLLQRGSMEWFWNHYVANRADPDGESTRLCLAHVMKAEGDQLEADRIMREEICNRSDDGEAPTELSERTKTIVSTHRWLAS